MPGVGMIGAGPVGSGGVGGVGSAGFTVIVATVVWPFFASTLVLAVLPLSVAITAWVPGSTNTGSATGDLPTDAPSTLTSAPAASTVIAIRPTFFLQSSMPAAAAVRCSGVISLCSRRNLSRWLPPATQRFVFDSARPRFSRTAGDCDRVYACSKAVRASS
jgi:hypothetical protein